MIIITWKEFVKQNLKKREARREKLTNKQDGAVEAQAPPGVSDGSSFKVWSLMNSTVTPSSFCCLQDKFPDSTCVINNSIPAQSAMMLNLLTLSFFLTADNVLLSEDGRDACLCDFGHAERLDNGGQSLSGSKGKYISGLKAILEEAVVQNWGFKCFLFISYQT